MNLCDPAESPESIGTGLWLTACKTPRIVQELARQYAQAGKPGTGRLERHGRAGVYFFSTNTAQWLNLTTRSATEPSSMWASPVRPCEGITIRSALIRSAKSATR